MLRFQTGNTVFGTILDGLKTSYADVGLRIMFLLVQHKHEVIEQEREIQRLSEHEIDQLETLLGSVEVADVLTRFRFTIRTTDVDETAEAQKQNMMTMFNLLNMFYEKLSPVVQMMSQLQMLPEGTVPEEMKAHLTTMYVGLCKMMSKLLKFFGEQEPGSYLPPYEIQETMQAILQEMQGKKVEGLLKALEGVRSGEGTGGGIGAQGAQPGGGGIPQQEAPLLEGDGGMAAGAAPVVPAAAIPGAAGPGLQG